MCAAAAAAAVISPALVVAYGIWYILLLAALRRGAQDGRELPMPLHGGEGDRQVGETPALQGLLVSPRDQRLHVPGR